MRHPREMGGAEVQTFLSWLANRRGAAVSTHKQALAALIFLYKRVLDTDLPWMQEIGRPRTPQRLPVVMSRAEVQQLLNATTGEHQLVFRLLYGTGMRKMECLRLRVKVAQPLTHLIEQAGGTQLRRGGGVHRRGHYCKGIQYRPVKPDRRHGSWIGEIPVNEIW